MYTVGQLREMLEGLSDDVVVKIATQPTYPFTHDIAGLNLVRPNQADIERVQEFLDDRDPLITEEDRAEARAELERLQETPEVLYVLEGGNQEYASGDLWNI